MAVDQKSKKSAGRLYSAWHSQAQVAIAGGADNSEVVWGGVVKVVVEVES